MSFQKGDQVVYVPSHLWEDEVFEIALRYGSYDTVPGVEFGFVMRPSNTDLSYFVRYWRSDRKELRTKMNSENTPEEMLYPYVSVSKAQVDDAIEWIEKQNAASN